MARTRPYPLRGPLDAWIVLPRTFSRCVLCLNASAHELAGQAILRVGAPVPGAANRWHTPSTSLLGRSALLIREERDRLRLFRTPWSESIDPRLPFECRLREIQRVEESDQPWRQALDPADAADLLVRNAVVPLCDDTFLERVLRNAQGIVESASVMEVGSVPAGEESTAPMAWRSTQLQSAFAPPRGDF